MNLAQIRRYLRDGSVPGWRKLVVVGALAYVVLPVDLVPDLVPLLGWLDDAGALVASLAFFLRDVAAHARRAEATPAVSRSGSGAGVQIVDATPLPNR